MTRPTAAIAILCAVVVGLGVGYRLGQRHPPVGLPAYGYDQVQVEDSAYVASCVLQPGAAGRPARRVYHRPTCGYARRIDPEHRVIYDSAEAAEADGCTPCKRCCQ